MYSRAYILSLFSISFITSLDDRTPIVGRHFFGLYLCHRWVREIIRILRDRFADVFNRSQFFSLLPAP